MDGIPEGIVGQSRGRRLRRTARAAQTAALTGLHRDCGLPPGRVVAGPSRGTLLYCADAPGQTATGVAACTGCATSWRGLERAHCRECHVTFDDEVLFDAHRLTGRCVPPERLDLVAVGQVWCRLLTGQQRGAAACPIRTQRRQMS